MNPKKNSDKEKEAEIAANRFIEMMEQQALYERIAAINTATKSNPEEEDRSKFLNLIDFNSPKVIYLKWAVAASIVMGLFLFFLGNEETPKAQIATINTTFRGTSSLQSRSVINGKEIRTDYADVDDLIDAGKVDDARAILTEMENSESLKRTAPVSYRQGILALQVKDFTAAVQAFRQTVDSSDMEYIENAYWNLLLSHRELNNMDAAKIVAKEMEESPHITEKQKKEAMELVQNGK